MGPYLNNYIGTFLRICMVIVNGPGNKAPVELLTHPQRQLKYSASNWANNAIFSVYCFFIALKIMGPYLKNVQ